MWPGGQLALREGVPSEKLVEEFFPMRHGSLIDPPNRFEPTHREADLEHLEWDEEYLAGLDTRPVEYLTDASRRTRSSLAGR